MISSAKSFNIIPETDRQWIYLYTHTVASFFFQNRKFANKEEKYLWHILLIFSWQWRSRLWNSKYCGCSSVLAFSTHFLYCYFKVPCSILPRLFLRPSSSLHPSHTTQLHVLSDDHLIATPVIKTTQIFSVHISSTLKKRVDTGPSKLLPSCRESYI